MDYELQSELVEVNDRLREPAAVLAGQLISAEGRGLLTRVWAGLQPTGSLKSVRASAKDFVALLDLHPAGEGAPLSRIGIPIFPDQDGFTVRASQEAGRVLLAGSLYLGVLGLIDGPLRQRLWDIAVGADVANTLLRNALVGQPLGLPLGGDPLVPPDFVPPETFDYLREFVERNCFAGVTDAMLNLGRTLQGWSVTSNADHITEIDPSHGCGGQTVTIRGAGFGNQQPSDTAVYFPTSSGGCAIAEVMSPNGWSDQAIEVTAPSDVGTGCVGFVVTRGSRGGSLVADVGALVGEVTSCLGPLAGERVRAGYEHLVGPTAAPCPPCLANNANRFTGGPPVIQWFRATRTRDTVSYTATSVELQSGDMLELAWSVDNATQVQITPVSINGQLNELSQVVAPSTAQGNVLVDWLPGNPLVYSTFSWDGAYRLQATNSCGSVLATVTVRMRMPEKPPPGPNDFLWGIATAGRQVEGHLTGDDWQIFTTDRKILDRLREFRSWNGLMISPQDAGAALDHWAWGEFTRSVERARALGLNAYRLSIEWSRIEPTPGRFDSSALGNYQMMIDAVRAHGMEPVVVLSHLSLPAWVLTPPRWKIYSAAHEPGANEADPDYQQSLRGWETTATVDAYVQYVEYAVTNLRNVQWWITFNEPLSTTVPTGYLASVFPPGFLGDGNKAKAAIHNIITAHARAYERIHALASSARVGITDQWLQCKNTPGNETHVAQFVYYHQDLLINALVHGDEDRAVSLGAPQNERVLGIPANNWSPHIDFFGLQYYKSVYPYYFAFVPWWFGARVDLDLSGASYHHELLNDMGWEIDPEGLYACLMKLKNIARYNNNDLPILVAENGTAEIADHNRSAYITSHLQELQRARDDGASVIGYLHWSISDNWEWIDGYRKEARFGLFSVDLPSSTPVHSITDGALALAYSVGNPPSSITASIDRYGGYQRDGAGIDHPSMSPYSTWQGTLDGSPMTLLLATTAATTNPPPARQQNMTGLVFHDDARRWMRLEHVVWEAATRTLQFSYTGFAVGGPVPDRVFAATLDPTSNVLTGVVTESSDYTLNGRAWQATRVPFAGMWQGQLGAAGLITLSLTYAEQIWRGRVLRATDWSSLSSIQVTQTGLTATETIVHPGLLSIASSVSGVFGQGSMVVSPWGASLQRLSDGVPF